MFRMVQPQPANGLRDKQVSARVIQNFSRTQSDKNVILDSSDSLAPGDSVSSFSSMESLSPRSRERSRSRDIRDRHQIPQPQTSYSWRKNFDNNFNSFLEEEKEKQEKEENNKSKLAPAVKERPGGGGRVLANISENLNQSPSMSILQIRLAGESRLRVGSNDGPSPSYPEGVKKISTNLRDAEKSTLDVDVLEKRELFEGKQDDHDRLRLRRFRRQESLETPTKAGTSTKTSRENWNAIREKHCPISSELVNQEKGESLRSSILGDPKISFKNLKFSKQPSARETNSRQQEAKTDKSIASTKEFEDTATEILNQMRKQRRSLQMEYVSTVSVTQVAKKPTSSWRDRISDKPRDKPQEAASHQKAPIRRTNVEVVRAAVIPEEKPVTRVVETVIKEEPKPLSNFSNPLEFILMREEYVKKNPPPKKTFVKQRDVESDSDGEMSMESVMKSLKKIVKAINPKRDFAKDKREDEKREKQIEQKKRGDELPIKSRTSRQFSIWDERMKKYYGASIVPFNRHASRWNSCQDLNEEQRIIDKKAVRERIKNRVLSSVHQALENRSDDIYSYCESKDFYIKGKLNLKPSKYKLSHQTVEQESVIVYECVEYRKRELADVIAHFSKDKEKKKKSIHVKPTIHGLTDSKTERFLFATIVRSSDLWETVKPINVAVKIKTELFAPKSSPMVKVRAKVTVLTLLAAVTTNPGYLGSALYADTEKWEHLKGCALFSICGKMFKLFAFSLNRTLNSRCYRGSEGKLFNNDPACSRPRH